MWVPLQQFRHLTDCYVVVVNQGRFSGYIIIIITGYTLLYNDIVCKIRNAILYAMVNTNYYYEITIVTQF